MIAVSQKRQGGKGEFSFPSQPCQKEAVSLIALALKKVPLISVVSTPGGVYGS